MKNQPDWLKIDPAYSPSFPPFLERFLAFLPFLCFCVLFFVVVVWLITGVFTKVQLRFSASGRLGSAVFTRFCRVFEHGDGFG